LAYVSNDPYFDREDDLVWGRVRTLFACMRDGASNFNGHKINRFNGGLFEGDANLDTLKIPSFVFCEKGQGQTGSIERFSKTLLYFSAKYNFGTSSTNGGKVIDLYTLGRIFEQSITDLEVMEAHAEGRESLVELSKRKRDGVYYTPEWVTEYIVRETVGARLAEIRQELGVTELSTVSDEEISAYRTWCNDRRKKNLAAAKVQTYLEALKAYGNRLNRFTILDPACGSGAFLVQAFRFLMEERKWVSAENARIAGPKDSDIWETNEIFSEILSKNIYGVDLNPESVEITRLALWLNTTLANSPLTSLDQNILCGNSLIEEDYFEVTGQDQELFVEADEHRVNPFNFKESFPVPFARGGFDCIIGNPPYVKLQHFRRIQPDVAKYLLEAKDQAGRPKYESAQTGNFDLYLPFIERGLSLLHPEGKMGYIAPSLWMKNDYGRGLRNKLLKTRQLERWVDFKSFQVFAEAMTYTALQFFSGQAQDSVRVAFSPAGLSDLNRVTWTPAEYSLDYGVLDANMWVPTPANGTRPPQLISSKTTHLGSQEITSAIFQGIKTSADDIFVLVKIGSNKYRNGLNEVVEIEDTAVRTIASAKGLTRFRVPRSEEYLIFPYAFDCGKPRLLSQKEYHARFPLAWQYLLKHEPLLRKREHGRFDTAEWYRFSRPQNLEKQTRSKLLVAGTAMELTVASDPTGEMTTLGGRVYSIVPTSCSDYYFLLALLNTRILRSMFRSIARPKAGGYLEAETQFLSPLPIPVCDSVDKSRITDLGKALEQLFTKRFEITAEIERRLRCPQTEDSSRKPDWLWADVRSATGINETKHPKMAERVGKTWAREYQEEALANHLEEIDAKLSKGVVLSVTESLDGEIVLYIGGVPALAVYTDEPAFIAAQWRQIARTTNITDSFTARKLVSKLLDLRSSGNQSLKDQVVTKDREIGLMAEQIESAEQELNTLAYRLYGVTDDEIRIIEESIV